ncbi:MAG: 4Fe-4S dicluster domain-containing protein [Bacillota bacterium]
MTQPKRETVPGAGLDVNIKWCKGCGLCVDVCPKNVLSLDDLGKVRVERPEECTGCGMCEATCPDLAISVVKPEKENDSD